MSRYGQDVVVLCRARNRETKKAREIALAVEKLVFEYNQELLVHDKSTSKKTQKNREQRTKRKERKARAKEHERVEREQRFPRVDLRSVPAQAPSSSTSKPTSSESGIDAEKQPVPPKQPDPVLQEKVSARRTSSSSNATSSSADEELSQSSSTDKSIEKTSKAKAQPSVPPPAKKPKQKSLAEVEKEEMAEAKAETLSRRLKESPNISTAKAEEGHPSNSSKERSALQAKGGNSVMSGTALTSEGAGNVNANFTNRPSSELSSAPVGPPDKMHKKR